MALLGTKSRSSNGRCVLVARLLLLRLRRGRRLREKRRQEEVTFELPLP